MTSTRGSHTETVFRWVFLVCKPLCEPSFWRCTSSAEPGGETNSAALYVEEQQKTRSRLQLVRRMRKCLCCVRAKHVDLNKQLKGQALRLVPCTVKQMVLLENFLCGAIHQHPALHLHPRRPRIPPSGWGQNHLSFLCVLKYISNRTNNSHSEVVGPFASFGFAVKLSRYVHSSVPSMF